MRAPAVPRHPLEHRVGDEHVPRAVRRPVAHVGVDDVDAAEDAGLGQPLGREVTPTNRGSSARTLASRSANGRARSVAKRW